MSCGVLCLGQICVFFPGEAALLIIVSHKLSSLQAGSSVGDCGKGLEFDNCSENFDGRKLSHEPLAAAVNEREVLNLSLPPFPKPTK